MSVQDTKELAQDIRYVVMSGLYTQSSLPDSNLVSSEEQEVFPAEGGFIKQN
jgi:hypothetical protein